MFNIQSPFQEKAPFEAKAAKRKSEYEKQMNAYNNKQDDDADEESDKSKSEVDEESGQVFFLYKLLGFILINFFLSHIIVCG